MRLLPTEYLYYYYRPEVALAHLQRAGTSRGQAVASAHRRSSSPTWPRAWPTRCVRYQQYLAARDASYMQLETGTTTPRVKPDWAELSGYDRIALMTISAIAGNTGAVIPLDLPNRGTLPFLEDEDIVEVPCVVDANGPARPAGGQGAVARPRAHRLREGVRARHGDGGDERRARGSHRRAGA